MAIYIRDSADHRVPILAVPASNFRMSRRVGDLQPVHRQNQQEL
jgi:hypothetical protein